MDMRIEQGQIWEVMTNNFLTSGRHPETKHGRPVKIDNGEKIEIRYPYAWHFRTEDNFYFHASPEMITDNCKLIGIINEDIQWKNKAKLEEILRLELFNKAVTD